MSADLAALSVQARDFNDHFGLGLRHDYFHASAGSVHDVPTNTDFAVRRSTGMVPANAEYRF